MIARPIASGRPIHGRRGISIIETIVLMTGVAAMLGLCVVMLQLLLKLDGQSRARLDGATAMARLARQFREDVHASTAASLVDQPAGQPPRLRIEAGAGREIGYEVHGDSAVVRTETRKGARIRRERYDIPQSGSIRLSVRPTDRPVVRRAHRRPPDLEGQDGPAASLRGGRPGGQEQGPNHRFGGSRGSDAMNVNRSASHPARHHLGGRARLPRGRHAHQRGAPEGGPCPSRPGARPGTANPGGMAGPGRAGSALYRLAASAGYTGEAWSLAASDLGLAEPADRHGGPAALVRITVEKAPGTPRTKAGQGPGRFPPDPPRRVAAFHATSSRARFAQDRSLAMIRSPQYQTRAAGRIGREAARDPARFTLDRAPRGDRHHLGLDRPLAPGRPVRPRGRPAVAMRQQPDAVRDRAAEL